MIDLYKEGQAAIDAKRDAEEVNKLNTLRGGHTGCVTTANEVVGKCHRTAHLRSIGIQTSADHSSKLMFEAGFGNEDIWVDILSKSWKGAILCEEEIPTHWLTSDNVPVTGRPDIVLCDDKSVPQLGIELKLVSSPWTAYNRAVKEIPDIEHICQAAHYMWQLNVPYKLCYTSRSNYSLGFGAMKNKWVAQASQYLNEDQFKALPFIIEIDMWIDNDVVWYQGWDKPIKTIITASGIKEFYERTAQIEQRKSLGPRPVGRYADGTPKEKGKTQCDYCEFAAICDDYESDYDRWLDEIKRKILTKET